jgi:hypothetical protein
VDFGAIDPILIAWSQQRHVSLSLHHRDEEVRSFELVGIHGRSQIWIETDGELTVHVWDYGRRRHTLRADHDSLAVRLDEALAVARSWCDGP